MVFDIKTHGNMLFFTWILAAELLTSITMRPWRCMENPDESSSLGYSRDIICWQDDTHFAWHSVFFAGMMDSCPKNELSLVKATLRCARMVCCGVLAGCCSFLSIYCIKIFARHTALKAGDGLHMPSRHGRIALVIFCWLRYLSMFFPFKTCLASHF